MLAKINILVFEGILSNTSFNCLSILSLASLIIITLLLLNRDPEYTES